MRLYSEGASLRIGFLSGARLSTVDEIFHIFSIVIVLTCGNRPVIYAAQTEGRQRFEGLELGLTIRTKDWRDARVVKGDGL